MSRAKKGVAVAAKQRHKKVLKLAKGYRGRANNCFTVAIQKVEKALQYAYRDRRNRKRDFRALWIQRINAAARIHGLVYSQLMGALKKMGVDLDRKVLADMAVRDENAFAEIANQAKSYLDQGTEAPKKAPKAKKTA
jgi:large subunit ribosomal protein L20